MSLESTLEAIFDAERSLRLAEAELLQNNQKQLSALLTRAVAEAKEEEDPQEAELRLVRLVDLCAQVPGEPMTDALISILDEEQPSVRVQAAEALVDVGYDRYAEVARSIERFLESGEGGAALEELPFIIAEISEPSAAALIGRFLEHEDGEVVAAAIEALARLGDTSALPALNKLVDDRRVVTIDEGDEELTSTVGELATEAAAALSE
ncbi:MAG TPA: HEAT repeat domain-containing protein [Polyangiales bacterium]|nr:HEAT repeat domain-containing protein [Polyangiales bacterium]